MKTNEQHNQYVIDQLSSIYTSVGAEILNSRALENFECDMAEYEEKQKFYKNLTPQGVWVWESGRDCDGVRYGTVHFLQIGTFEDYCEWMEEAYSWADGPMHFSIIPEDEVEDAKKSQYSIDTFAAAAGY